MHFQRGELKWLGNNVFIFKIKYSCRRWKWYLIWLPNGCFDLRVLFCWWCVVGYVLMFVQDKLQTLAAGHSDILETLSPKVRKRVEVLREIQVSLPLNAISYECCFALVCLSWIPLLLVSIYITLMMGFEWLPSGASTLVMLSVLGSKRNNTPHHPPPPPRGQIFPISKKKKKISLMIPWTTIRKSSTCWIISLAWLLITWV